MRSFSLILILCNSMETTDLRDKLEDVSLEAVGGERKPHFGDIYDLW